ncbi:MAG: glycosyltransferase family 4 protein [Armatimonadetes bacterium]|nr:glycosyltransferase family 4 protein [Armatimonadota bacterium]
MSGGEIALLQLLESLDRSRFEPVVVLFADGPFAAKLADAGVETHVRPLESGIADTRKDSLGGAGLAKGMLQPATHRYVLRLRRFIAQRGAHIVHTNSLKADLIGGMAARLGRKPLIWHIRDRIAEDYLPPVAARLFRRLCRHLPHRVIANSAATLATLGLPDAMTIPGPRQRALAVHDGMEPPPLDLADVHRGGEPAKIGLVGRLAPWKGQHVFLEAAAQVHRAHPDARFLIIGSAMFGESDYEERIRRQCRDMGLDGVVEFTGFREDVQRVIAGLTILVHASTVPEPFGQVVLEGMMAAKPVVATRGGGVSEIMLDGETGILVPMGDAMAMAEAINTMLRGPGRAQAMGLAARRRAETEFTIARTARKVEAVYDDLLRGRH